jgi:thioredoxin reductase
MHHNDYIILGAGPAGLQTGYFLSEAGIDYKIIERALAPASFYTTFPRRRELISFNRTNTIFNDRRINLRFDWNSLLTKDNDFRLSDITRSLYPKADGLVDYLQSFSARYRLNINFGVDISSVCSSDDGKFILHAENASIFSCYHLIVATGFSKSFVPEIPGIELCEGYESADISPEDFEGKRILIIGKGNSAFEVADIALETASLVHIASPSPVKLAWKSRHPGHVRANHVRLLDSYQLKLLNGTLDCHILDISSYGTSLKATVSYVHADGEIEELIYDRIIRCTGFSFDDSIFDKSCKPRTVIAGKLPATTPFWESVNIKNLFFAGTLTQARDFKRASSAFIGGFRYNARTLSKYLASSQDISRYPREALSRNAAELADYILERCNTNSALWAQFGYLCDIFIMTPSGFETLKELPYQALDEGLGSDNEHMLSLVFEWGEWPGDEMEVQRHPTASKAYTNVFLHPILRRHYLGKVIATHHILEDLFGVYTYQGEAGNVISRGGKTMEEYHEVEHRQPLISFLSSDISDYLLDDYKLERSGDIPQDQSLPALAKQTAGWDG